MKKKNTVLDIDGVARELFEEEGSGSGSGLLDSIWNTAKPYWDKTTDIASSFFFNYSNRWYFLVQTIYRTTERR